MWSNLHHINKLVKLLFSDPAHSGQLTQFKLKAKETDLLD